MHIHYLKHVPFEGLGSMENIFVSEGHRLSNTCLYLEQPLPPVHSFDALIIMGGPMGVHDTARHPWLVREKEFVESAMRRQIPVLGVCLGAQLLAEVLGARVSKNIHEEIGWFPVQRTQELHGTCAQDFPASFEALHWHGDTFSIPSGATNFIASEGCANQAFVYGDHALALQFHLEMLPSHVQAIYQACGDPNQTGPFVQGLDEMLAPAEKFCQAHRILKEFIRAFISRKTAI
ncbi:MAG: type 1 glutamine amidotransferase [Proteobacteria bacterium]|nr:type 1 glutamine amidotransferase [Pseudomonadota bacterium]